MQNAEHHDTIIIGGGQAGLTMGYHLKQRGVPFVILDANERVGHAWRARWDSLRLFTPARYCGLDGMPYPGSKHATVTKDGFADYLEHYARHFELPIRTGARVDRVTQDGARYTVRAGDRTFTADRIVVANGAHRIPRVPGFARELDPSILQLHSDDYLRPSQLQPGGVLLVGVGNSGADISLDVVKTHATWLAGKESGHVPFRIESYKARFLLPIVRFVGHQVLSKRTPIGRKAGPKFATRAAPLIRVKPKDIVAAGVERVGRVAGAKDGRPLLDDGRVLDVANVIWCTGYRHDYSFVDMPVFDDDGVPFHDRGIVEQAPGLYFLGMLFQFSATSDVITGVGRDARHIADHIVAAARAQSGGRARAAVGA